MHIPKCAGSSLKRKLQYKYGNEYKIFSNEVCYDYLYIEENTIIKKYNITNNYYTTMIRKPIDHVYSQYLECKYYRVSSSSSLL